MVTAWPRTLDRKLGRELWRMKAQVATIALVLGSGIAAFIMLHGVHACLVDARDRYYDTNRFAHVFARVVRAPESLAARLETLPGAAEVETRIAEAVTVPIAGMPFPAYAWLVSLPEHGQPRLNALTLTAGRLPEPGHDGEVLVLDAFARAHGLKPGHRLPVVMNGRLKTVTVVGAALSPEYVFAIRPGAMADDPKRYTVLWMRRPELAAAFELEGAFNDVTLRLQPGASEAAVRGHLDRALFPYGNDGSYARRDQISNRIVASELEQLSSLASMVPIVFLGVATFLIRLVLGRIVALQRGEIAALKAVGYTNGQVGRHYLGLVAVVIVPAGLFGVALGQWLGVVMLGLYTSVFRFPHFEFQLSPAMVVIGLVAGLLGAAGGAMLAVRAAVKLPPAEAMRPPAPARFRRGVLERIGAPQLLGPVAMMVLREALRQPLRTFGSALGIAGAIAMLILARFGMDSMNRYFEVLFQREQRQDLAVSFEQPLSARVLGELRSMPGVFYAEPVRVVPARARHGHLTRDVALMGLPAGGYLRQLVELRGAVVPLPDDGVVVTRKLGDLLAVQVGDAVTLELKEGERRTVRAPVVAFVDEAAGLQVYGPERLVAALSRDDGAVSSAMLSVDPAQAGVINARLSRSPRVVDVSDVRRDMERMFQQNAKTFDVWTSISVLLASAVIVGVVYNNARIALTARSRELASLRVLGFTRREISLVLIGGLALEVGLAVPAGLALGYGWAQLFSSSFDQETFRFIPIVSPRSYFYAAAAALVSAAASALWVRRHLDRLDLIAVLKERE